jgi:hypothetical protein
MLGANNTQPVVQGQRELGLKEFAIKACVSIALAIGLLAAGEGIAYLSLPKQVLPPADYKAYVLWQMVRPGNPAVTLDADGLRRTFYSHCEANEYTIWMFGSSVTWGPYSHDWETISSFLAKQFEESGRRVCVKNYGQPGWGNTQEVIELLLELKRAKKKPDAVIFLDGSLDSFLPYESDQVDVHMGFPEFKREFESWKAKKEQAGFGYFGSTNTYLALQRLAHKLGVLNEAPAPRSFSQEQVASMAKRTMDNYLKNMEVVDSLAIHHGFHYLCFWEPYLLAVERPLSPSEELIRESTEKRYPGFAPVKRATYELFRALKRPDFVYLGDLFNDPNETLFLDAAHFKPEGNRIVAERIYVALRHLGL